MMKFTNTVRITVVQALCLTLLLPAHNAQANEADAEPESIVDPTTIMVDEAPLEAEPEPIPATLPEPAASELVEEQATEPAASEVVEEQATEPAVVGESADGEETFEDVVDESAEHSVVELVENVEEEIPLADAVTVAEATRDESEDLALLKARIPPGTYQRLSWSATELFEGVPISTPVLVVNGRSPGPTLCLTAALHGDELNGIEVVRRVMHNLDPAKLSGAVIGVPIVNLQGFRRGSRYLPDRRDLNRYFPGNSNGSAAARIANSFFTQIINHCDALVDLHTGSFERANLPQLRADLTDPDVRTITMGFGATVILHSEPAAGTLRAAATAAGVPTVTLEAGGPSVLELKEVKHGVKGIETLLNTLGMVKKISLWGEAEPVYYRSTWVRADSGGILLADVNLGSTVRRGDLLGTITDPMNNASTNLYAPYSGRIIGMARNQIVMPGFAAFHVGIETEEAPVVEASEEELAHDQTTENDDYVDGMSE